MHKDVMCNKSCTDKLTVLVLCFEFKKKKHLRSVVGRGLLHPQASTAQIRLCEDSHTLRNIFLETSTSIVVINFAMMVRSSF